MRVLVLGGTGHVGCAIAREAVERGFAVAVLSRQGSVTRNLEGVPVEMIRADVGERPRLRELLGRFDLVVDAAAPYPLHAESGLVERAVARMRGLVRDVAESGARFVYVGSFVTLPHSPGAMSRMIRATHPYFAVKAAMEDVVLDACERGLRAVLVNPGAFSGPWDSKPIELALVPMLMRGRLLALVSTQVEVIDVRDVAAAVFDAVAGETYGRRLGLVGHELHSEALVQRICTLAGVAAPRACIPESVALAGAMWGETASRTIGRHSPMPALTMMLLHENRKKCTKDRTVIPLRELDETLRDTIEWWRPIR